MKNFMSQILGVCFSFRSFKSLNIKSHVVHAYSLNKDIHNEIKYPVMPKVIYLTVDTRVYLMKESAHDAQKHVQGVNHNKSEGDFQEWRHFASFPCSCCRQFA